MTKQRAIILEVLRSDKKHHTAEEIFILAKERMPTISRATVYNTLHYLEGARLIRRISGEGGPDRYDNSYEMHGHLVCEVCGGVFDIDIPNIEDRLRECVGDSLSAYEIKVVAKCESCRTKS
jgi:Fe2+ or Zn2+ uptake regulation protein